MFTATHRQVRPRGRFSCFFLFGSLLTLATIVFPHHGSANTLTICKKTIPASPSGPLFNFKGANSWAPLSGKDFTTAYVTGPPPPLLPLPSNPFPMKDGDCKTLDLTGHDQFNKITELGPLPPGWKLTNISCSYSKSAVQIIGANPNAAFQPGDNTVSIDQADPAVTCTFVNSCSFKGQNLSTGVAPWKVTRPNGLVATPHTVPPNSNWASHSPPISGPPFPAGLSWIQPAGSSTLTSEPPGDYLYVVRFSILCPAVVKGWFAADNAATLVIDADPLSTVKCLGNASLDCFKQANVTPVNWNVGPGAHVIQITVTNEPGGNTLTGLLAYLTVQ